MTTTVVPRRYDHRDAADVTKLLTEVFGGWPVVDVAVPTVDHLRWKLASHARAPSYQVVAEGQGRIVGSLLALIQPVQVRGRRLLAQQGVDTVIQPAYQGQGLLAGMAAFAEEHVLSDLDLRFGHTGHPAALRHYLHTFRPFGNRIVVLERELPLGERTIRPAPWPVQGQLRFDGRIDGFFERAAEPFDFVVARSADYLNWRYCDTRGGAFAIRMIEDRETILGYSVLRLSRGKGHLADLLVLPGRDDVLGCLVADALDYFRAARVSSVEYWTPTAHPYRPCLREQGFAACRRIVPFLWKDLRGAGALDFLSRPDASVHLLAGDSDLV